MNGARWLVIHADDFGMSHSVNRATAQAFEHGWITSASILVPCPWFPEAAKFAREHPEADLGVHLALNSEWTSLRWGSVAPRDRVPSLLDSEGYFPRLESEVVEKARASEVEIELAAQVEKARAAGISITHLDSHMGTLLGSPPLFAKLLELTEVHRLPVRLAEPPTFSSPRPDLAKISSPPKWLDGCVEMGVGVPPDQWLDEYKYLLGPLPPGTYQLTVHLGYDDDEMRGATSGHPDWGAAWRQRDFDVVRSPAFASFLREQGFTLIGWRELARRRGASHPH